MAAGDIGQDELAQMQMKANQITDEVGCEIQKEAFSHSTRFVHFRMSNR